jgi:hypothetical protein
VLQQAKLTIRLLLPVAAILSFLCASAEAQPRRIEGPATDVSSDRNSRDNRDNGDSREADVEAKFFNQLRSLFGRFRDGDLARAFRTADSVSCAELVSDTGEWRPVSFFNEDRRLGDWYHESLDAVKRELSQYVFSGTCNSDKSNVRLVTKFPVMESVERYNSGRIRFDEIHLNVNPAVVAYYEPRSEIYTWELPYLYIDREQSRNQIVYTLLAQRMSDRPAREVTNHWECKSVRGADVTFQFLICQTWTMPSDPALRKTSKPSFGSSAYFILSDGKEASTSVKLSFGTGDEKPATPSPDPDPDPAPPPSSTPASRPPDRPVTQSTPPAETTPGRAGGWQIPDGSSNLISVRNSEFRVLFSAQTWANKVSAQHVLLDQRMVSPEATRPPGTDYCLWQPSSSSLVSRVLGREPETEVAYTITATNGDGRTPGFINLDMKTLTGARLGVLQCFFPRADTVASIPVSRWVDIVGAHLTLEVR